MEFPIRSAKEVLKRTNIRDCNLLHQTLPKKGCGGCCPSLTTVLAAFCGMRYSEVFCNA